MASVDVARGAIIAAGTPLLHLADRGQLQVRIGIEPADLTRLRAGLAVTVDAAYDGKLSTSARLDQLVGQIDSQSRMAEAIIEIPQGTGLLPGATVHAHIALAQRSGVLTVPHAAVLYADERAYVYLLEGDLARQAWVGAGQESGERIEIHSGIKEGDLVVIEGNYVLEEGMRAVLADARCLS